MVDLLYLGLQTILYLALICQWIFKMFITSDIPIYFSESDFYVFIFISIIILFLFLICCNANNVRRIIIRLFINSMLLFLWIHTLYNTQLLIGVEEKIMHRISMMDYIGLFTNIFILIILIIQLFKILNISRERKTRVKAGCKRRSDKIRDRQNRPGDKRDISG